MKKNRYTEEQIAYALKQAELGTAVPEICRKLGVAEQTFYRWRSKYAGMLPSDLKRLKQLEEEDTLTCFWMASTSRRTGAEP